MRSDVAPRRQHWDQVYASRRPTEVSWFQASPRVSLELIGDVAPDQHAPVVDVGGGASRLAGRLLGLGFSDVSVVDVSAEALVAARAELGADADRVTWIEADVASWHPTRRYDVWHDRAVFHFLVDHEQQRRYVEVAASAVTAGGHLVVGTFAPDGPEQCSGLPTARHDATSLAERFSPGFELVRSCREEHLTPAGVRQPFTWVVLRATDRGGVAAHPSSG